MMHVRWATFAILVLAQGPVLAAESAPELTRLAAAYLEARQATMQEKAVPADVDRVLASCAASLVYEHPRVGIRLAGQEDIRAGMVRFLGTSRNARIEVVKSLEGAGMAVLQTLVAFEAKDGTAWRPVERQQVWVFEFEGTKIKRILEYW